jgi:fatty acid desaturase
MRNRAGELLSRAEIRALTQRSNLGGAWALVESWGLVVLAFALAAQFPNPLGWLAAAVLLGSRQLALAIVMHEAAHTTLMRTRWLNEFCGQWLGAAPVFQNLAMYREHHLRHHRNTGTANDPDLGLATPFPVSRRSLARKLARDITGLTGLKVLLGSVLMLSGYLQYDASGGQRGPDGGPRRGRASSRTAVAALMPALVMQGVIAGALALCGVPELYLLWLLAYLTVFQFVVRVRSIAEHAMTMDPLDGLNNSRTTAARWWERLLYAPLNVNYHLEHHMLAAVPYFRLPRMHALLRERKVFAQPAALAGSYAQVLRMASTPRGS